MAVKVAPMFGRLLLLLLVVLAVACGAGADHGGGLPAISRSSFPEGFIFGTASSAYQEDVHLMKDMGMDAYRFSISWTRILSKFGDRVKHWITFNEPWTFCSNGYASGMFAPGRCSPWEQGKCSAGDSGREPYTACHHQLLAHAEAVRLYKEKYQFTMEQSELVKGSFDFIGLNYYTANYADNLPPSNGLNNSYNTDSRANLTGVRNGIPIGPQAASPWLYIYPRGFRELLIYVKENYGNPTIYITENGVDEANNKSLSLHDALKDDVRVDYYKRHLIALQSAIRDGANVKGYFAWSLLDNFEWGNGYTVRFGINFVDYSDGLKRYPKSSAHWFKDFLKK
ncbi:hypothetical protein PR202_gb15300 [Eleusine coracana subsp. coracana]|uniref:Beta-glucosidase n=1 Tax=Eleusine coracana subsp. coracana TaxID=191504 RepID=A0AAV5EXH5_ELECO|nr:hypothetical protein PR202_gb15300 [Eleusine coracana subsp. coracana]